MFQIVIAGRVGKDSELRTTQSGTSVLGFSVAADTGFGDKKKTTWIDCAVWGDRASKLKPHVVKGASVTIVGEGGLRTWDSNGKSGAVITCNVRELEFQGGGSKPQGQPEPGASEDFDDEIPF